MNPDNLKVSFQMEQDIKKMTFVVAMRDFFFRPGIDTSSSFINEIKPLTPEDRAEMKELLKSVGYQIEA